MDRTGPSMSLDLKIPSLGACGLQWIDLEGLTHAKRKPEEKCGDALVDTGLANLNLCEHHTASLVGL